MKKIKLVPKFDDEGNLIRIKEEPVFDSPSEEVQHEFDVLNKILDRAIDRADRALIGDFDEKE